VNPQLIWGFAQQPTDFVVARDAAIPAVDDELGVTHHFEGADIAGMTHQGHAERAVTAIKAKRMLRIVVFDVQRVVTVSTVPVSQEAHHRSGPFKRRRRLLDVSS